MVVSRLSLDDDSYDVQTLLIGLHLLPSTKEDATRILRNLSELNIPHVHCIRTIIDFGANPSLSNLSSFLKAKNEVKGFEDYYARIILNCADFIYEGSTPCLQ